MSRIYEEFKKTKHEENNKSNLKWAMELNKEFSKRIQVANNFKKVIHILCHQRNES